MVRELAKKKSTKSKKATKKKGKKTTKSKKTSKKKPVMKAKTDSTAEIQGLEATISSLKMENEKLQEQIRQLENEKTKIDGEFIAFKEKYATAIEKESLVAGISTIHDNRFRIPNNLVEEKLNKLYNELKNVKKDLKQPTLSSTDKVTLTQKIGVLNTKITNLEKFIDG